MVDDVTRAAPATVRLGGLGMCQVVHFDVMARLGIVLIKTCRLRFDEWTRCAPCPIVVTAKAKPGGFLVALWGIGLRALADTQKVLCMAAGRQAWLVAMTGRFAKRALGIIAMAQLAFGNGDGGIQVRMRLVIKLQ